MDQAAFGGEVHVLVIYTGGTIGMVYNDDSVLAPVPNIFLKKLRTFPQLHDENYSLSHGKDNRLVLPVFRQSGLHGRLVYTIEEYDPLLDSSNMGVNEWANIARDIEREYHNYDGFVILHGTDTLTYTASALSFMLENLGKSVVLTGSQISLFEPRSDGKDNFLSALMFAGYHVIPEVMIFFNDRLFRGNRTIKFSAQSFSAFKSPNYGPLATVGIEMKVNHRLVFRPAAMERFRVHTNFNENVGLLKIFPNISAQIVRAFLNTPIEGIVLQTYGSGNIPSNREDISAAIKEAADRGVLIVNCTQCLEGAVQELYETGKSLRQIGVVSGFDMTTEAALAKLAYVLSKGGDREAKIRMLSSSLRGELTTGLSASPINHTLIDSVAQCFNITSSEETNALADILYPPLVMAAVLDSNTDRIEFLKQCGADISIGNVDKRTPLHLACAEGNLPMAKYLLENGAFVHCKDRFGRTPLMDSVEGGNHHVTELLIKCGAHMPHRK